MDDQLLQEAELSPGSSVLDNMFTTRGLYVGGIPLWMFDAEGTAASLQALRGCVRDVIINGQ